MNELEKSTVQEIVTLHNEIGGYLKMSLQKATRIGQLLMQQKASLKHGEWIPWIKKELPFSVRSAETYLKCYAYREKIAGSANLDDAVKLLSEPKKKIVQIDLDDFEKLKGDLDRTLEIAQKASEEHIRAYRRLGQACNRLDDINNLHEENKRMLKKSDELKKECLRLRELLKEKGADSKVINEHRIFYDKLEEHSKEWDKVFKWAAKYYPEFECVLEPNPYLNMSEKELSKIMRTFLMDIKKENRFG